MQHQLTDFLLLRKSIKPWKEAFKIIIIYLTIGGLWILLSDKALHILVHDVEIIKTLQLYKGWFYVAMTGVIFYFIIHKKMMLFIGAIDKIIIGYEELQNLAYYDSLTGLPNRIKIQEDINQQITYCEIKKQRLAIIYLDIDNFKHVNDTMGHGIGDELIVYIADILRKNIKSPNLVARLGGDEFAIVLLNIQDNIEKELNQILSFFIKPWMVEEKEFFIGVSLGAAIYPEHGLTSSILMQAADTALFHRKSSGKNGYDIYTTDMHQKTLKYIEMSNQLHTAIQRDEFLLYYQPQIELCSNKIVGVEALIRWKHPQKGFISPMEFIPFAEEVGYIGQISDWVLRTACKQKRAWEQKGFSNIKMSINLSSKLITKPGFVSNVKHTLEEYQINCNEIEFEITETAVMIEVDKAIRVLNHLKALGISISLDDFGVGYSSLTYLQKLPIDILKIDREFIKNVVKEDEEVYIFNSIVNLAHNLGLKVVAEGVETKEQLSIIIKNGCDICQGYYYSKPVPAEELEAYFITR